MAIRYIFGIFITVALLSRKTGASSWSYSPSFGPESWFLIYATCGGSKQSPIDIISSTAEDKHLGQFTLAGFHADDIPVGATWKAINNGHSVQVDLTGDYIVRGGGLSSLTAYKAIQFHFHWGRTSEEGSEHRVDGLQYAGEMHIVCYNTKYSSISTAIASGDADALTVLGFLIRAQPDDNTGFTTLIDAFSQLHYEEDEFELHAPVPFSTLLPSNLESYYRYMGSLTTPACNQVVAWTIFKTPIMLSESQLDVFRSQLSNLRGAPEDHKIAPNFRPVQPTNGCSIYNNKSTSRSLINTLKKLVEAFER